ncbi:hypothetical protein BDL97_13G084100 [Sphagnum fallax]|nr:hypothetical protein BDL97_13G084100 [Sphagnum fallax]
MNNFKAVRGSAWREVVKEAYLWLKTMSLIALAANSQKMPKSANEKDDFMVAFLSFSKACGFTWVSVLAALISGEAMEVACRAFFLATEAAVPVELQALRDASPERRTGRRVSVAAIFLKRRVQFSNRHYSRHTSVSASRPRHLKILGLYKHLRTSDKFANEFLNFSSCSFSCSSSQDCRAVQHHNPVIYAD